MNTIEKIKTEGAAVVDKLRKGQSINSEEQKILKIYNELMGKKAGNSGKRKIIKTGSGK